MFWDMLAHILTVERVLSRVYDAPPGDWESLCYIACKSVATLIFDWSDPPIFLTGTNEIRLDYICVRLLAMSNKQCKLIVAWQDITNHHFLRRTGELYHWSAPNHLTWTNFSRRPVVWAVGVAIITDKHEASEAFWSKTHFTHFMRNEMKKKKTKSG